MDDRTWFLNYLPTWWLAIPITCVVLLIVPLFVFRRHRLIYMAFISSSVLILLFLLCIHSYYVSDNATWSWVATKTENRASSYHLFLSTGDAGIQITLRHGVTIDPENLNNPKFELRTRLFCYSNFRDHAYPLPDQISILGFKYWTVDRPQLPKGWTWLWTRSIVIPFWCVFPPLLIFPTLWMKRFIRNRYRRKNGLCLKCAYNLKESKEKCPECGTPISPRKEIVKAPDTAKPAV